MTEPASIRTKNPGAMWGKGNPLTAKWGSTSYIMLNDGLGQGNNIAIFPTWVDGICAQLELWRSSSKYRNKKFADAIAIWSGGNEVESYIKFVTSRVPGMTRDTVMDDAFWRGPMAIGFLKAQAWHEAGKQYPAPDADWIEAQRLVLKGATAAILPVTPAPLPPDVPKRDPVSQVTPANPPVSTGTTAGGAVVVIATTTAVAVHQGLNWPAIGLTAFIVAGLVTAVVALIRKLR